VSTTPRILAVDVSGPGGGAALLRPGALDWARLPDGEARAKSLTKLLAGLLERAGLAPRELDAVACGVGPGSFTGIRIGVATAGAFAYAAGLPAIGVGSLDGIVENAPADADDVLVALDARRGRLFAARFRRRGGAWEGAGPYENAPPAELASALPASAFVLGDARARYPDAFGRFRGSAHSPPRPDAIARIAATRFAAGERPDPLALRPLYLRPSEPEIIRAERSG